MRRLYMLFFLLTAFACAHAQHLAESRQSSFYTFIYKINDAQAGVLYRDIHDFDTTFLYSLHDYYPTDTVYGKKLPAGHYLFVKANDRRVNIELVSVNNIDVKLLNNYRDLAMIVYDSTGKELTTPHVSIKNKKILFDPQTKTFRLRRSNKRGVLRVYHGGHTTFTELKRNHNSNFFARAGRKVIGSFPVVTVLSPVFYLKDNIKSIISGGRPYRPPVFDRLARIVKPKEHTGYIAFNKPMYKPGDTVKLKAFITTRKGRPYNKQAAIAIETFYPNRALRVLDTITPFRAGAFKHEFRLADSLNLHVDQNYNVELRSIKRKALVSAAFRLEDYELQSNVYHLRTEYTSPARPATLFLKATDSNNLTSFDVRAEILITPGTIDRYYRNHVFVKDTLWFHQVTLESAGETKVIVPDSIMPAVAMKYTARISFLNSSNERVVKEETLSFDANQLPVKFALKNDSISVTGENGYDFPDTVLLETLTGENDRAYWRRVLGLDSIAFYRFIEPEDGYFEDRSPAIMAQFAPFVIGYGVEAIWVIYVDGYPVYYRGVETTQPYSFAAKPGLHTIRLRTHNALFTVNHVRIDSAQKLIFSLSRHNLPQHCTMEPMPTALTENELAVLGRHFIRVDAPTSAYLQQGERYHWLQQEQGYYRRGALVGPLFPGKMEYATEHVRLPLEYEPFYHYTIRNPIIKMKESDIRSTMKNKHLDWFIHDYYPFKDAVLTNKAVETLMRMNTEQARPLFSRFPDFVQRPEGGGTLTLQFAGQSAETPDVKAVFIVNTSQPDEYCVLPRQVENEKFNAGRYRALVILNDYRYIAIDSIFVRPFGLNYYLIDHRVIHEADTFSNNVMRLVEKWSLPENYWMRERATEAQQLRTLYYDQFEDQHNFTHTVSGRVTDQDGNGLPGVNVIVKSYTIGTVTDAGGYYSLKCPPGSVLVFSFIGYETNEIPIGGNDTVDAALAEDVAQLNEVVVVGYGVSRKQHMTAALSGRVAGVQFRRPAIHIRGNGTVGGGAPLVVLDGRVVKLEDIDIASVTASEVIAAADAVALYGARAANGVVLMSTKPNITSAELRRMSTAGMPPVSTEDLRGNALRKNFRDYAFWQPALKTNAQGKAVFHATFPDDVTGWNAYVLGMGAKRRTGQATSTIQTYKPVIAQIAHPHFMVAGDRAVAVGRITNYMQDTVQLSRTMKVNARPVKEDRIELQNTHLDSISIAAGVDSVRIEYTVAFNGYKDGELRTVPVLRKGTPHATGQFVVLDRDTTIVIDTSTSANKVSVYAEADLLDVLLAELKYLKNYAYECNEQLASKLKALLLEREVCDYKKISFTGARDIQKILRKLTASQNNDGSWGWWKEGRGEAWVTLHVASAVMKAQKAGYHSAADYESAIDFLDRNLSSMQPGAKLETLIFLGDQGQMLAYKHLVDSITMSARSTMREKLLAARLSHAMGNTVDWQWLNSMRSTTVKGNYYWGEDRANMYDNAVLNTLLVYQMALRTTGRNRDLVKIENYLLEKRKNHWRNTYESSTILENLLPRLLKGGRNTEKPRLQLSGATTRTIDIFPFDMELNAGPLKITKTGAAPVYLTAYTEAWDETPREIEGEFAVRTSFMEAGSFLPAGKPVTLEVMVDVKGDAECVMIEVPIPAGCSYQSKPQMRSNGEVHCEYFDHKTNIYCRYLKRGSYRYEIPLLPRYAGKYTLNPAVAACMYFPTLFGRTALKEISIGAGK